MNLNRNKIQFNFLCSENVVGDYDNEIANLGGKILNMRLHRKDFNFSNDEIVENANQLGVSLGSSVTEISNSVNDLLDLEAERA